LFAPEQALLAAKPCPEKEPAAEIGEQHGLDSSRTRDYLKQMARSDLVKAGRIDGCILRGIAELGINNIITASSYSNTSDLERRIESESYLVEYPFELINYSSNIEIDLDRGVICRVSDQHCTESTLKLGPIEQFETPPQAIKDSGARYAHSNGLDMQESL
jgi:hypothetical protein